MLLKITFHIIGHIVRKHPFFHIRIVSTPFNRGGNQWKPFFKHSWANSHHQGFFKGSINYPGGLDDHVTGYRISPRPGRRFTTSLPFSPRDTILYYNGLFQYRDPRNVNSPPCFFLLQPLVSLSLLSILSRNI